MKARGSRLDFKTLSSILARRAIAFVNIELAWLE